MSQDKEWPWDTWLETEVEMIRNGKDTPENDSGGESWGETFPQKHQARRLITVDGSLHSTTSFMFA